MAKAKTAFFCQSCGYESPKWVGKCPSCSEWNTMVEETVVKTAAKGQPFSRQRTENFPVLLTEIQETGTARIHLKDGELNRVLGGGLVLGEIILIGGDPGIGKSTLLLQMAVKEQLKVLYVSGEESEQQIKMRAERLGISNPNCHLLIEADVTQIINHSVS